MAVIGLQSARRKTRQLASNISVIRAERAIKAALITGSGYAAILTPVDTSFLINSRVTKIEGRGFGLLRGTLGYMANYAAAVHDPKRKQTFKKPGAEKEFLRKGFDDNRPAIDAAVMKAFAL
jgi:hypothetical protein